MSHPTLRAALAAGVFLAAGCGGPDAVSGKVTVRGQPVTSGMVTFVGADNKEAVGTITADGTYRITAPPRGAVRVTVKALPGLGGGAGVPAPSSLVRPPKNAPPMPPSTVPAGPKVPAKYANPADRQSLPCRVDAQSGEDAALAGIVAMTR